MRFRFNYALYCIPCLCMPLFPTYTTYTTIIASLIFISAYNHFVSISSCSLDLYSGYLHTKRLHTRLTEFLFFFFIVLQKQFDERSWCRKFVFSLPQELYHYFIVVCVFFTYWLLLCSCSCLSSFLILTLLLLVYS